MTSRKVESFTPPNTMAPIGPYSHIARAGDFIAISATAGVDPSSGELAGADIASQTTQILDAFEIMLAAVGSDLDHIMHINVFLKDMDDFKEMNTAYAARMGVRRPARTVISVVDLPKQGALLTMNLTAVTA
jgi:2-iminobutanoate/2-iminopropanoate deaminase